MRRITKLCLFVIGIVTAVAGAACGNAETAFSPTGPSAIGTSAGAVISGRVNGVTAAATSMDTFSAMDSRALTVSVVGTNVSTTVDGSGQFTLTGVPAGTVQLKFTGSGVDATVTISGVTTSERIEITVTVNGGGARIESQRRGRGNGGDEVEGVVSELTGECPTLTFTVRNTRVTTSSTTAFDDMTCASVANGMRVEVHGARQADGSLAATRVEAEDDDDVINARVEMNGPVASLDGVCPAVNFIVQGTRVTTSSATLFEDVTCATLRNGVQVEVEGERQADGSVLASEVEARLTEIEGVVSGLTGACPAITFTVQGTSIVTDGATRFKDVACAALQNGMQAEVEGVRQADGSVMAARVEGSITRERRVEGAVSGLTGTCPAVSFTVQGTTITTSSVTRFQDASCAALQNGMQARVEGQPQADGSVLAARVEARAANREQRVEGAVSGLTGACPAISFTVQGATVTTSGATRFDDTTCARVADGMRVEVRGLRQADGSILASRVEAEDDDDDEDDD